MSFILPTLKGADRARYHRAVQDLNAGSLTITITRQTDSEVRALVQNGDGRQYGVTINAAVATCSCFDALFRGAICKHACAVAIYVLGQHQAEQSKIHLWRRTAVLPVCGEPQPKRFSQHWFESVALWPDACPACLQLWRQPQAQRAVSKDEFFYQGQGEQEVAA